MKTTKNMLNKNKAMHKTRLTQTRKQNTQVMQNQKQEREERISDRIT